MGPQEHIAESTLLSIVPSTLAQSVRLDFLPVYNEHQLEIAAFILGIAVHISLFRRGEWDLAAGSICQAYLLIFGSVNAFALSISVAIGALSVLDVFITTFLILVAHVFGLGLSICVYRQWFHRLRGFPGPSLAGVSSLYMLLLSLRQHQSETWQRYHEVYGDYVRICPTKLSILDPAAVRAIYGRESPTLKGPFTVTTGPRANLNMCRDKIEHARRRKFWDRAFSTPSLRSRIPIINKHAQRLLRQLQSRASKSVDMTKWCKLFSFDVLFDIGFGQDKRCLEHGHEDFYMSFAQQVLHITGIVMHAPWMMYFCSWIPALGAKFGRFQQLSADTVNDRLAKPADRGDLYSIIARSYDELKDPSPEDLQNLTGDADLLVLAGADSVAASIANVLYELAINPAEQEKLRQALTGVGRDLEEFQIRGNKYLDAVIHEGLRLNPPAPAGHERITPPEGLRIGERYIPGNVSVFVPHYALFRDVRFFEQPAAFIPERWTTRPELVKDASVYYPFLLGRNTCSGRPLALMEMRTIIHMILSRFSIQPASADVKKEFIDGRDDRWLLAAGELNITLHELEKE